MRHAVCVLNRLVPLSYTAARLGGAEHDLARVRGVAGGDRVALIGSLTAVLDRQPAAVSWATSQLERLRDRAVSALAYEFAARVQAEIEGWTGSAPRSGSPAWTPRTSRPPVGPQACWPDSGAAMAGSAAGGSGHAAWPAPPRRWPPPGGLDRLRPAQRRLQRVTRDSAPSRRIAEYAVSVISELSWTVRAER